MAYFVLAGRVDGTWHVQFGDRDRECVQDERTDYIASQEWKPRDVRVIRAASARQRDVDAAIAELNAAG